MNANLRPSEPRDTKTDGHPASVSKPSSATPTVSVIIPVHNGGASFRECLSSLAAVTPPPTEIIVVADGDSDGSWRVAEQFGAQVVRLPEAGGPARARNAGARQARSELLVFLDADVTIHPDALDKIAAAFGNEPELAALFGSYDDAPAKPNFLSQYKNLLHHFVHQTSREEASTFWAGCGAIRREVFLAMGGFDEAYRRPSIEDIELGYRLTRAGHRIQLCKTVQVKHLKRWTPASLLKADLLLRAVPWTELILRDRRFVNDLNLRQSDRVSVVASYGVLGCLAVAWWWPWSLIAAGLLLLTMLALNARLFAFLQRKRGAVFALAAIPWFWFSQLYSGLGFAVGLWRHWTR